MIYFLLHGDLFVYVSMKAQQENYMFITMREAPTEPC